MAISNGEHTFKRFDQELEQLRNRVLEMGGLVEDQIDQSVNALQNKDLNTAREVIARDQSVNSMEVQADEDISSLLALRQPMGRDLRTIMALAKTITDLERVGDEAERIARMTVQIHSEQQSNAPANYLLRDVLTMAKLAIQMLRGSLDAMARLDVDKAVEIARGGDQELDDEFQSAFRRLITYMMEDPRTIGPAINMLFIIKALERIGDHSTNIAEYVIYLVKGKDVRHMDMTTINKDVLNNN